VPETLLKTGNDFANQLDTIQMDVATILAGSAYAAIEQAGGPTVLGCCAHVLLSAAEAGIVMAVQHSAHDRSML
jgi:hypothetical protein